MLHYLSRVHHDGHPAVGLKVFQDELELKDNFRIEAIEVAAETAGRASEEIKQTIAEFFKTNETFLRLYSFGDASIHIDYTTSEDLETVGGEGYTLTLDGVNSVKTMKDDQSAFDCLMFVEIDRKEMTAWANFHNGETHEIKGRTEAVLSNKDWHWISN